MSKFLWTQRSNFGPSPRAFHALAYDCNRKRVALFGGNSNQAGSFFGDTWEWDGSYWTQMDDIGPAARSATQFSIPMLIIAGLQRAVVVSAQAAGTSPENFTLTITP